MISWKYSFKRLNEEYEIAKKKKQALDSLFETGRISQTTRDSFESDLTSAIAEIEKQQKDLAVKMQGKVHELENQVKTLETLLANYEIQHVVGEIEEEVYQREISLLTNGLDTAKHELENIKDATKQLCSPVETPAVAVPPVAVQEIEPVIAENPVEEKAEKIAEVTPEIVSNAPTDAIVTPEPAAVELCPPEPVIAEEAVSPEPIVTEKDVIVNPIALSEETAPEVPAEVPVEVPAEVPVEESSPYVEAEMPSTEEITVESEVTSPLENVQETVDDQAQDLEISPQIVEARYTEDLSPVVEIAETDEIVTAVEAGEEAHPQLAPKEAQPEAIVELGTDEENTAEETTATEETSTENTENSA